MRPNDGGKLIKAGGTSAEIRAKIGEEVVIRIPLEKEKRLSKYCRAIIGIIAGQGRLDKPLVKAGNNITLKSKNKLWPRTSAIKMNAIDHPFGSVEEKFLNQRLLREYALQEEE
jgi:large subunit ribosomal protein L2